MSDKTAVADGEDYGTFRDEEAAVGSVPLTDGGGTTETAITARPKNMKGLLKSEVKAARETGDQVVACSNICKHICSSVVSTVILGLSLGIPIAMVYMGATHLHNCPRERFIPIYILVFGVFLLLKGLGTFIRRIVAHARNEPEIPCEPSPADGIVGIFLCCWFIAGNVWIIRTHNDFVDDPNSDQYCERKLYDFVFWLNAVFYFFLWAAMILGCCLRTVISCVCSCFLNQLDDMVNAEED